MNENEKSQEYWSRAKIPIEFENYLKSLCGCISVGTWCETPKFVLVAPEVTWLEEWSLTVWMESNCLTKAPQLVREHNKTNSFMKT